MTMECNKSEASHKYRYMRTVLDKTSSVCKCHKISTACKFSKFLIIFFPFSFKDVLSTITSSKEKCIAFLQKHNVISHSMICPGPVINGKRTRNCGKEMLLKPCSDRKDKLTWRCRKVHTVLVDGKKCVVKDVKVSIRSDTWIYDSNLSLECIVEMMYLWSQGFSNNEIQHELKVSKKTLIEWTAYFRDVAMNKCMRSSTQIGGPGIEVEIDESKFGKRKYHKGHRVEGKWVFGGRETYDKSKIFMIAVENRKADTLLPIIQKWIAPGSIIHSDCWKSYNKLSKLGYTHVAVNHSKEFVNKENAACTNRIECEWRHAKCSMPRYGVHKGLHDGYLAQFLWHRTFNNEDKFLSLLKHCNEAFKCGEFSNVKI